MALHERNDLQMKDRHIYKQHEGEKTRRMARARERARARESEGWEIALKNTPSIGGQIVK